jgi:preprotein translocase subunit SecY
MRNIHQDHESEQQSGRSTHWYDRIPVISSSLYGTVIAAALVGTYLGHNPDTRPVVGLLFFVCLSVIISYLWHWVFLLHPRDVAKRIEGEQSVHKKGSEAGPNVPPIHPH